MPPVTAPPIFASETLLLLALSCTTDPDGLSTEGAIRRLAQVHDQVLTVNRARSASKNLMRRQLIENGTKKVPDGRETPAKHYRLTDAGRIELQRVVGVLRGVIARAPHRSE
jgi:hypothetical protein